MNQLITTNFTVNYEYSFFKLNSDKTFVVAVGVLTNYKIGLVGKQQYFNLRTRGNLDYVS